MSENRKEAEEEKMAKAIFISGDGWLAVFDLLAPSQLGLGIALISHRFDCYVDEHFKTRKWALEFIIIRRKIGKNGTMEIVNCNGKPLPMPKIQLPRKITDFKCITISYIDRNVLAFLYRFRPFLASFCPINLFINTSSGDDHILVFILRKFWLLLRESIRGIKLSARFFRRLRQFVPSFLTNCPSLCFVFFNFGNLFIEFPADDSAMASDGQAVAKWLFTPHPNNVPKVLRCCLQMDDVNLVSKLNAFKAAFSNASSPVNFIAVIWFPSSFAASVVLFDQINELTREQLALKGTEFSRCFLLIRCPIARDANKWTKWEKEAIDWRICDQWNRIDIQINDQDGIEDGLLDATFGQ
ncbi:hypothetical protein niasHT_027192 [Heterodera trifolii]|uniref:Uncharacterized protein n=1 Tax=Heterodera trifolii TaxID=157864 RepID=A0ABD2KNF6_9BILA